MNVPSVIAVEGLDRLGKTTLVDGLRQKLGYHEVIHFSKPQTLEYYRDVPRPSDVPVNMAHIWAYQHDSFVNSMQLANSGANIIFDRWHIGEAVWSPMFRGFSGDYVFNIEKNFLKVPVRLILLIEDFAIARHFVDDGESLGTVEQREEIQKRFIEAVDRSSIKDKRIICVTDPGVGGFKPREQILAEALA